MRTTKSGTFLFFISGYIPLFIYNILVDYNLYAFLVLTILSVLSLYMLSRLFSGFGNTTSHPIKVKKCNILKLQHLPLSYFIPYLTIGMSTNLTLIACLIIISGILAVINETVFLHPILFALGCKFYVCDFVEGNHLKRKTFISNRKLNKGNFLRYKLLTDNIGIAS